jgi:5-methylcytosine-specific restriction endonuclease McrA
VSAVVEKVCRVCREPGPGVYGGKYPRHVCRSCQAERLEARTNRRSGVVVTYAMRAAIYAEANGCCVLCGVHCQFRKADRYDRRDNLAEIDHVHPVKHGGGRERANLRLLCKKCNREKGATLAIEAVA